MQTITEEYRKLNEELHRVRDDYGAGGMRWAKEIFELAKSVGTEDILDYGCGKSTLAQNMPFNIQQYDPAIPKYSAKPHPADIVTCTDVLEHIEPDHLDDVLADLARLTRKVAFMVVATREAKKTLPDGRNAHLIVEDGPWWFSKMIKYFDIQSYLRMGTHEIIFVAEPLNADNQRPN